MCQVLYHRLPRSTLYQLPIFLKPRLRESSQFELGTAMVKCAYEPFRLLSLPSELQLKIYAKYLEDADFTVNEHSYLKAVPRLAIEQTCHRVCADVRNVRERVLPRAINVIFQHATFFCAFSNDLASQSRYKWLREHIATLVVRCERQL